MSSATSSLPTTLSYGLTFFPISSVGIYSNYSEGFLPVSNFSEWIGSRGQVDFTRSKVQTLGLRGRFFKDALIVSGGYYSVEERDRVVGVPKTNINNIWNAMGRTELLIGGAFSTFNDTLDYEGEGYELDLTANFGKTFKLIFNVALPKTSQTNGFPDLIEYYNANIATWQAAAVDPTLSTSARNTINTNLTNVNSQVNSTVDGRSINDTFDYRANIFGTYTFRSGFINGFALGAGANFFGRQIIGNQPTDAFDYVYADAYYIATANASYTFKLNKKVRLWTQLSVANLFNYEEPIYRNTFIYNNVLYRNNFNRPAPQTISLTCRFLF